jgi:hypothetical protein
MFDTCRHMFTEGVEFDIAYRGFHYVFGPSIVRITRFFGPGFALLFLAAALAFALCSFAAFISLGVLVRSCLM